MFDVMKAFRIKFHSKEGKAYFAPRHVTRKSQKVIAINQRLIRAVAAGRAPATLARQECISEGKYYVGRDGKQHADWNCFKAKLRKYMKQVVGGGA